MQRPKRSLAQPQIFLFFFKTLSRSLSIRHSAGYRKRIVDLLDIFVDSVFILQGNVVSYCLYILWKKREWKNYLPTSQCFKSTHSQASGNCRAENAKTVLASSWKIAIQQPRVQDSFGFAKEWITTLPFISVKWKLRCIAVAHHSRLHTFVIVPRLSRTAKQLNSSNANWKSDQKGREKALF